MNIENSSITSGNEKRNFVSWNRHWVTVRRHAPMILKPFFAGLAAIGVWLILYSAGIYFPENANDTIRLVILAIVGFAYVIFAGIAVTSVFSDYKIISKCVVKNDMETFLLYRDEQLPIMMHILIATPSIIIVTFTMLMHYEGLLIGSLTNFAVVYILVQVWAIATELDDFEHSIWFKEKIPSQWLEIDVEEYFKKKVAS